MYVIMMKDSENGIYLAEQVFFYTDLREAIGIANALSLRNQDTMYEVLKVDLYASNYEESKNTVHDIIYESQLYKDIESRITNGNYEIMHKVIYSGDDKQ